MYHSNVSSDADIISSPYIKAQTIRIYVNHGCDRIPEEGIYWQPDYGSIDDLNVPVGEPVVPVGSVAAGEGIVDWEFSR